MTPPTQAAHTTYRLDQEPSVGVLWTYAEPTPDGGWRHVGGGTYHPETDTYGQGAFNADDVSRAAVVYLRHWQATGSTSSRHAAYELLRGLTYLQTSSGPNAGNVVLWMQPDGTLNPSADPKEQPDPSDSDASYWLARTIWAFGEGYAAFARTDPAFASFLRSRLDLAVDAVDRQVLDRYGDHLDIDGQPAPAWLIADGADATGEAVLGLSAYVSAGGSASARTALAQLSDGSPSCVAATRAPGRWARSGRGRCPARCGMRGVGRRRPRWPGRRWRWAMPRWRAAPSATPSRSTRGCSRRAAPTTDGSRPGPTRRRSPTASTHGSSRCWPPLMPTWLCVLRLTASPAWSAAWYFGANPAGQPMYDPATGVTFDGISGSGQINHNSGAESTIHGLLSMIALDEHPAVARGGAHRRRGGSRRDASRCRLRTAPCPVPRR